AITGCRDTIQKDMIIHPLPVGYATGGDTCRGDPVYLSSSGGLTYKWFPATGLSNPLVQNPIATPTQTTLYNVQVTNEYFCSDTASATVNIVQPPPQIIWDTTIVIGQEVPMFYHISPVENYTYSWTYADSLTCSTCWDPNASPMGNIQFILTVQDIFGCFIGTSYYDIEVLPVSSLDVPSAFTPNGDGVNDLVFVRGWGIKQLLEFNIYNRWGELVFSTDDINQGWDGKYKGVLQNIETYAYTVKAETFIDADPITKKGFIKLLR
ncbi:MAG: gliding motility-associated C-terminal domain-containing protein, partial [Bacteroidota bacterium]|nr:gliding motility-associated C-terminal domain-containing protein [Bacteroidota bacterium]